MKKETEENEDIDTEPEENSNEVPEEEVSPEEEASPEENAVDEETSEIAQVYSIETNDANKVSGTAEVDDAEGNNKVEMESTDNVDLDEESTSQEVDSQEQPDENVALVEGVTTSMPAKTVVTTAEMMDETVKK